MSGVPCKIIKKYDGRTSAAKSCPKPNWYQPRLELERDAASQRERDATLMRSGSLTNSYYPFDFTGAVTAWAEGAKNRGVLIKLARDDIISVGWGSTQQKPKPSTLRYKNFQAITKNKELGNVKEITDPNRKRTNENRKQINLL